MGNLFSRTKEQPIIDDDDHSDEIESHDQFFDCLNDDESHENIGNTAPSISHYYAVWIPANVETTETQFVFDDMKCAFSLCKKYSKYNSRVKIFASQSDADIFIQQQRENGATGDDLNMSIERPTTKPATSDAEKLPYSDVPTAELTKLYNLAEKGNESELQRLVWSNPRYLISSGDSPTIVKISVRYNVMHVAALSGQASIIRIVLKTIKDVNFIRRLYTNDTNEQTLQRMQFILDMYLNTPDKMQNETPLHLACKFGHYEAVSALLDEPRCDRNAVNKAGQTPENVVCSRSKDKSKEKKILELFESIYYIPIQSRKVTMEKIISKPIDEATFKPLLNAIEERTSPLPIEWGDNDTTLIAFAGPTIYELAMQFYNSVSSSTRGQGRRAPTLAASPKSPVNIVRTDAEKGWERIARSYALETYSINWCEYWPFLDAYVNLSSADGLRLLEYYLQQRVLHSQVLKSIDQFEKFSSQYLAMQQQKSADENDPILNSISHLIQSLYTLIDLFDLHDLVLNRRYRAHLETCGFHRQQDESADELNRVRIQLIEQLQWLSTQNNTILRLFTRALLNCLTMVFTLLISPSGCALIDQIQQRQYEARRQSQQQQQQQKTRPASRLSLIGLVCPKRRQHSIKPQQRRQITRSNSWPDLTVSSSSSSSSSMHRRSRSQIELNRNNNYNNNNNMTLSMLRHSSTNSSVGGLNETTTSIDDINPRSLSISQTPPAFSSQTSVDMLREDKTKVDKWHYFLAGSQPTKLDAHVVRAIDINHKNHSSTVIIQQQYRLWPKWYQAVHNRPIEEQNLWTTPIRNGSPSNRRVLHPGENQASSLLKMVTRQAMKRKTTGATEQFPPSTVDKIERKRSKR